MAYENAALAIADVEATMERHADHLVCEIGEDGEQLLILGHLDDDQARAVVVAYASAEWGYDDGDVSTNPGISRGWYAFTPHHDGCADDVCAPCIEGRHDECTVTDDTRCDCADTGEGHRGTWCSCDEFRWWASRWPSDPAIPFPAAGHPAYHAVTWVQL